VSDQRESPGCRRGEQVDFLLSLSGLVVHADPAAAHAWEDIRGLGIRALEASMLQDVRELEALRRVLRPHKVGAHWPLFVSDRRRLDLLAADHAAFAKALEEAGRAVQGQGLDYLLFHFPERGEPWPAPAVVQDRLDALAAFAARWGLPVLLEPKETLGGVPAGFCAFADGVSALPPGVELCVDVSDWQTARDNLGRCPTLRVPAAEVHLHARHVQPNGPYYRHAVPWVELPEEPGWTTRNVSAEELVTFVPMANPVRICVEVVHHYLPLLPASLAAVRAAFARLGWREASG
jgi:hypothetical protein